MENIHDIHDIPCSLSIEETPKKIVRCDLFCFLCACTLNNDRVRVFGKSSVDIPGLIKSAIDIDATVFQSSDLLICTACYKKLLRFEKILSNLRSLQSEIKENYEKRGLRSKRLRKDSTLGGLADSIEQSTTGACGRSSTSVTKSLKFPTTCTSSFGQEPFQQSAGDLSFNICPQAPSLFLTSTPVAKVKSTSVHVPASKPSVEAPTSTSIKLVIQYPSKPVNKLLSKEYEAIGKALAYGPPTRLANAVVKCKELNKLVVQTVMKLLSNEVSALCSRNNPPLLRKCAKEDLVNFDLQSLCEEWKERAPLFFSFLMTCCISTGSTNEGVKWLPSAAVAGSVLLCVTRK